MGLAQLTSSIKSISTLKHRSESESTTLLSTVSSDGLINLYDLNSLLANRTIDENNTAEPAASHDTKGSRLTCVFLADGQKEKMGAAGPAQARSNGSGTMKGDGPNTIGIEGASGDVAEESDEDESDEDAEMYDSAAEGDDDGDDGDEVEVEFEDEEEDELEED